MGKFHNKVTPGIRDLDGGTVAKDRANALFKEAATMLSQVVSAMQEC